MYNIYLKEDDYSDIHRIGEYNKEYITMYPDFKPFVTEETFNEFLDNVKKRRSGINNNGVKEIYYFAIEDDKIVGHGSIRINPEINKDSEIYGNIMYSVVPSKRNKGYGTIICKLLLEQMKQMGFSNAIVTCNEDNIGSNSVIKKNQGILFETRKDCEGHNINRYKIKL